MVLLLAVLVPYCKFIIRLCNCMVGFTLLVVSCGNATVWLVLHCCLCGSASVWLVLYIVCFMWHWFYILFVPCSSATVWLVLCCQVHCYQQSGYIYVWGAQSWHHAPQAQGGSQHTPLYTQGTFNPLSPVWIFTGHSYAPAVCNRRYLMMPLVMTFTSEKLLHILGKPKLVNRV